MRFSGSFRMRTGAGGWKPDLVFFGESVPKDTVDAVHRHVQESDALLVVGSSLMVCPGYRFTMDGDRAHGELSRSHLRDELKV